MRLSVRSISGYDCICIAPREDFVAFAVATTAEPIEVVRRVRAYQNELK